MTSGLSPVALTQAHAGWAQHLLLSPDEQIELIHKAARKWARFFPNSIDQPLPQDKRFAGQAWQHWPFKAFYQNFLLTQQWWHNATTGVPGVSRHHEDIVSFLARQALDIVSPANFPFTNPEVIEKTAHQGGMNFVRGALNFWKDWQRICGGDGPVGSEAFKVGREVAVTPGKVVFRNRLIELIQYAPTTVEVYAEPILIVPAWIMKYYILDLSPGNSLVHHLVENGHTVFVVSWKNPQEADRDLGMEDYRRLGVMAALDAVSATVPERAGPCGGLLCLGGTLLAIAAAAMARDEDERLKSVTLFAAQSDFTEAGELTLFIDDDQVRFLEDVMAERGYLDSKQMAGAFQLLRSNDLVWSPMVRDYLMGDRRPMIDLTAWNADATRMPCRMHSEYLRRLYLNNDLAEGRFEVNAKPVSLRDIHVPLFAVSTIADHIAPWRSVYKIQMLTEAEVTFVLSNGGHNAGIVNPPGHPNRHYQIATHKETESYADPDAWQASAVHHEGSWWPCWLDWLDRLSGTKSAPPPMGGAATAYAPLCDAPGTYVLEP